MPRRATIVCMLLVGCLGLGTSAQAELVAEWDFRVNEDLTFAKPGTSSDATLQGSASIDTGPALPKGFREELLTGSLVVPVTGTSSGLKTASGTGEWRDYMGAETFGQTTVVLVYKPNYNGVLAGPRKTFFNVGDGSGSSVIWLFHSDDAKGPRLILGNSVDTQISDFVWDSNKWYFIAASWFDDPDLDPNTDTPAILYVREMSVDPTVAHVATDTADLQKTGMFDFTTQTMFVGVRQGGTDEANGQFALVRIYADQYSTVEDLDALYLSLLPEPTTAAVLLGASVLVLFRRRAVRLAPVLIVAVIAGSMASPSRAAIVAEWDFRDPSAPEDLSENKPGTSADGLLNPGSTTTFNTGFILELVYDFREDVGYGSMTVNQYSAISGAASLNHALRTSSSWAQFNGSNFFGTGTVLLVFKPDWVYQSGVGAAGTTKLKPTVGEVMFSSGGFTGSGGVSIGVANYLNSGDLALYVSNSAIATITDNDDTPFVWDNDTWYLIVASWKEGEKAQLFLQPLTGAEAGVLRTAASANNVPVGSGPFGSPVYLGGANQFDSTQHAGRGEYALFRWYDTYTGTPEEFAQLSQSLVPEPATASLLLLGVLLARSRRRAG